MRDDYQIIIEKLTELVNVGFEGIDDEDAGPLVCCDDFHLAAVQFVIHTLFDNGEWDDPDTDVLHGPGMRELSQTLVATIDKMALIDSEYVECDDPRKYED